MKTSKTKNAAFRNLLTLVLVACMMMSVVVVASADISAVQKDADCVLQINFTVKNDVGKEYKVPSGTCFLINEDTVLTCYHVIDPDYIVDLFTTFYGTEIFGQLDRTALVEKINSSVYYSVTVTRDITVNATLINGSESMDFAILKLSQPIKGRNYISLRNSKEIKAAETVYALGFPSLSDQNHELSTYTKDDVTYSSGVVSKAQDLYTFESSDVTLKGQFIQTTCKINSGNSGGPMVDENGNAIGISSISQGDSFYYGVATDQVIEVLDALGIKYTAASGAAPAEEPAAPVAESTPEPTSAPAVVETPTEPVKETKDNGSLLYIIIAAVAAVIAVVVVVLVLSSNNKKKAAAAKAAAARPKAPGFTAPPAGGTGAFTAAPATPARPVSAPVIPASDPGATTILQGKVEATTVLANGGTLTRVKNGDKLDIKVQEILVGRDSNSCSFWISGNSNIGRKHAKFLVKNGTTYVVDMNSTNGTFVNGTKLQPNVEVAIKDGDKITLADEDFKFTK